MIVRIISVSSIVNQPPCRNFAIEAMKNMNWMDRNTIENTMAPTLCRLYHMYTASSTVVVIMVIVNARPYAAEICSESRNRNSTASVETHSTPLTTGMYSWPRVRAG